MAKTVKRTRTQKRDQELNYTAQLKIDCSSRVSRFTFNTNMKLKGVTDTNKAIKGKFKVDVMTKKLKFMIAKKRKQVKNLEVVGASAETLIADNGSRDIGID